MFHNYVGRICHICGMKRFNALAVAKLIVSAINTLKTMAHCAQVASYFIDDNGHFLYIWYGEGERADPQRGVTIITWFYHASWPLHKVHISKSVDSLCRDGADAQYMQYLSQNCTTSLKVYLSAQPTSSSAFVISKTHTVAQKPHGRQLNAKG